jgi:putative transposase
MPRIARVVAVGLPHHITQRGNYRQDVFFDTDDRRQYLLWIGEYSAKYGLSVLAYCLMQNHVHFIAIPREANSLAKTFNAAHMRYSQYFNKKLKQRGHLWQGRFYSCVLDESHLMLASRYIERNPVRAGREVLCKA